MILIAAYHAVWTVNGQIGRINRCHLNGIAASCNIPLHIYKHLIAALRRVTTESRGNLPHYKKQSALICARNFAYIFAHIANKNFNQFFVFVNFAPVGLALHPAKSFYNGSITFAYKKIISGFKVFDKTVVKITRMACAVVLGRLP